MTFQPGLKLEQAPPISVPFRFFLTAPLFLLAAAAVLLWRGPEVFESRMTPAALAVAHLYTLGFMTMVMTGAMMQMLPVLAGAPIPRPEAVGSVTHAALTLGTIALAGGFLFGQPLLLKAAAVLLATGFAVFIAAVVWALSRISVTHNTVRAVWLAIAGLLVTVSMGLVLVISLGWGITLIDSSLRTLHPGWGLLGWVGLLAVGVAYQVVPMFQITPGYPEPMARYFAGAVFALLALWSLLLWGEGNGWGSAATPVAVLLIAGYFLFAGMTLSLQQQRRRRLPDVTLNFWRIGMGSLIAGGILWIARATPGADPPDSTELLIGVIALQGFAASIITGMLYKITPFLVWFHLQAMTGAGRMAPNMKKILADGPQRVQLRLHVAALGFCLAAVAWPERLPYAAALVLGIAAVMLLRNLLLVVRAYRDNLSLGAAEVPATARH